MASRTTTRALSVDTGNGDCRTSHSGLRIRQTGVVRPTASFAARRTDAELGVDIASWWLSQRSRIVSSDRPLFDSVLLLVAWSLWKERNARVIGRPALNVNDVVRAVWLEGEEWALGCFMPFVALTELWSRHSVAM